eukprot:TRINITY_DN32881_c0_g1_i1.p1 TRINITY_DN32881_c0_g1~~TRINITY_DN32881_c0_g1_i1.p1  ORF type:complete len:720 (+),score=96.54 TRINITY_DN32881_c0_g1_i1:33-2192(+)
MSRRSLNLRHVAVYLGLVIDAMATVKAVPLGCFFYGWKISSPMTGLTNPTNATDALACQKICEDTSPCKSFGFQPESQDCWLGGELELPTRAAKHSFTSGPAKCTVTGEFPSGMEANSMCASLPGLAFPGATAKDSASAFPTGVVPVNMQCWPHYPNGELASCSGEPIVTLEDTATGWAGRCLGLHMVAGASGDMCEESCRSNISCASWQIVEVAGMLECWQGTGYDCYRDSKVKVVRAQRVMRGHYRVLDDLRGHEVSGLKYAFGSSVFGPNLSRAVQACNHTCLAYVNCQAWTYSTGAGCFFDDPGHASMEYPLTQATVSKDSDAAALVIAGQYVQRLCTVPQDLTLPTTTGLPTLPPVVLPTIGPLPTVAPLPTPVVPTVAGRSPATSTPATQVAAATSTVVPTTVAVSAATSVSGASTRSSDFVKLGTTGDVFYMEKAGGETLHQVTNGCGAWSCEDVPISECKGAVVVDEAFLDQRSHGEAFVCEMLTMAGYTTSTAIQAMSGGVASSASREFPSQDDEGSPTDADQSSGGWVNWLIGILVLLCLCAACNYGLWYYYIPIVRRYPWLDGYLPFQWGFTTSNTFTKLRDGYATSTFRDAEMSRDTEAEFPLMYPGGFGYGGPGMPPMMPAMEEQYRQGSGMMYQDQMQQTWPGSSGPGMLLADQGYDLVTVTPNGLQVTPLGNAPVPQGVPIVNPLAAGQGSVVNPSLRGPASYR